MTTETKQNIYSADVAAHLSGSRLAWATAEFLNANDRRCKDYNEYGHGEQLFRLLLAAYDLGAIQWDGSEGEGDSGYWRAEQVDGVRYKWAQSLGLAADDIGFYPDEVRAQLAGEPTDWDCLSEGFEDSQHWYLSSLWLDAQEAHEKEETKWDKLNLTDKKWREASKEILAEGWENDEDCYDEEGDRTEAAGEPDVTWTLYDALAMRAALIDTPEARLLIDEIQLCESVSPVKGLTFFPAWIAESCANEAIEEEWCNGAEVDCENVWHTMEHKMREAATKWAKDNT